MTCEDFIPFIDTYVDQEFDERERAEMEAHLSQCDDCRQSVAFQIELKREFQDVLSREKAPDDLRERIFADIEQIDAEQREAEEARSIPAEAANENDADDQPWLWRHAWVAAPLAAAIALVIAMPAFTVAPARSDQLPVVEQTVDWHKGNYPIEVTGPDATAVSSWFRNKVDFPVRLPTFKRDTRVNLLGGRIAHILDRRAAYLLYEVNGKPLSVMVFDGEGINVPSDKIRKVEGRDVLIINNKGYEVAVLQDSGMTYTMTSELPERNFVDLVSSSLSR